MSKLKNVFNKDFLDAWKAFTKSKQYNELLTDAKKIIRTGADGRLSLKTDDDLFTIQGLLAFPAPKDPHYDRSPADGFIVHSPAYPGLIHASRENVRHCMAIHYAAYTFMKQNLSPEGLLQTVRDAAAENAASLASSHARVKEIADSGVFSSQYAQKIKSGSFNELNIFSVLQPK